VKIVKIFQKGAVRKICEAGDADSNQAEDDDVKISIDTSNDGSIRLCCADPQVLQVGFIELHYLHIIPLGSSISHH